MKTPTFSPQLFIQSGVHDVSFYENAFGAVELRRFTNEDGSIHVVEFSIGEQVFQLHEQKSEAGQLDPEEINGTTVLVGLFVDDVDVYMKNAVDAGAIVLSPAQSYDYGYRQGIVRDPFGHRWMLEGRI